MMSLVLHRPRKGSTPAAQPMPSSLASAGTPPLHRGSPYSRSLPESSQSSTLYHYGSSPQAAFRLSSASVTSPVRPCAPAHALQPSSSRGLLAISAALRHVLQCFMIGFVKRTRSALELLQSHSSTWPCAGPIHRHIFVLIGLWVDGA